MDLKKLHSSVVTGGSSEIEQALGLIERYIIANPTDQRAYLYKGSIVSILGQKGTVGNNASLYIETGLAMMLQANEKVVRSLPDRAEFDYVRLTTLAVLSGHKLVPDNVNDQLISFVDSKNFETLGDLERVNAQALAACIYEERGLSEQAKSLFRRASKIDCELASKVYENWLERASR